MESPKWLKDIQNEELKKLVRDVNSVVVLDKNYYSELVKKILDTYYSCFIGGDNFNLMANDVYHEAALRWI